MVQIDNVITITDVTPGRHSIQVMRPIRVPGRNNSYLYNGTIDVAANTESYLTVLTGLNKIRFDNIIALNNSPWQQPGRPINPIQPAPQVPVVCQPVIPAGPVAMSTYEFNQLMKTLNNTSFESTRMQILKQAMPYNFFTTQQVRELMSTFWFESSKLEVAKAAYTKTVDQYNYYLVNNEFSFGSSVRELGDYLAMN